MHILAFVISFKENRDRRNLLKERFRGIGIDPVFIDAVRGSTLSDAEKSPFLHSGRQYVTASMMQDNAMGCALSHFRAWEALLASDAPFALIFEDDAGPLREDIMPHLHALAEMADQLDVVILSNRRPKLKRVKVKDLAGGTGLFALRYNDFGAESYFISRRTARKLLAHPRRYSSEVDFLLHHWWYHDSQVLHFLPPLFGEDGRTSTIGYSSVPGWPDDRIWHRISRRFVRAGDSLRKRLFFPGYVARIKARLAKERLNTPAETSSRLLIIQPMVGIGDMVWHKPWLDAAITRLPQEVMLMAKPSSQAAMVLAEHDGLQIIPLFRSERGKKGRHDGVIGFFRLVLALRSARADAVWILHRSWRYAAAAMLAGIPERSGYGLGKQSWYLNKGNGLDNSFRKVHPREAAAAFFAGKGLVLSDTHPRIIPRKEALSRAAGLLEGGGPLIIFGVGAADAPRRWSPLHFAGLIDQLSQRYPDYRFALCGSPAEAGIGDEIMAALSPSTTLPMKVFDQSVETVIALHASARLYIGNDTSLINIAAAVGTPAVRIFASTLPVLDSPLIRTVLPADKARLDIPGSIDDILPGDVLPEVERQLKTIAPARPDRLSKSEKRRKRGA